MSDIRDDIEAALKELEETLKAVTEAGGTVVGVGFDKSDMIQSLIRGGHLLATMAQNPDVMGYEGVKSAVKALDGGTVSPEYFDTGVTVLDKSKL